MKHDVNALLDILNEKERNIIELRYGLSGKKPMSLKEIGDSYSLTKERIRQIEKRALQKLQKEGLERQMDSYSIAV
jgi:RNA polymerase primary sigma factor